jgi:AraC family transcriptional regulator of adaptative response/methylated-DNA-[protein]-cysteine methyltransferase
MSLISLNLTSIEFETVLGPMIAIADEQALYLLEFMERRGLKREIEKLHSRYKATITPGKTNILDMIGAEITDYFAGKIKTFTTPIHFLGSPFQKMAWNQLQNIPYGETKSYAEQATSIGKPKSYRAVANANGANQLCIIVPCHRIINSNGALGGYGGGISRKKWLLEHEQKNR